MFCAVIPVNGREYWKSIVHLQFGAPESQSHCMAVNCVIGKVVIKRLICG